MKAHESMAASLGLEASDIAMEHCTDSNRSFWKNFSQRLSWAVGQSKSTSPKPSYLAVCWVWITWNMNYCSQSNLEDLDVTDMCSQVAVSFCVNSQVGLPTLQRPRWQVFVDGEIYAAWFFSLQEGRRVWSWVFWISSNDVFPFVWSSTLVPIHSQLYYMQESAREHDGLNLQVFRVPPNDKKIQKARPCVWSYGAWHRDAVTNLRNISSSRNAETALTRQCETKPSASRRPRKAQRLQRWLELEFSQLQMGRSPDQIELFFSSRASVPLQHLYMWALGFISNAAAGIILSTPQRTLHRKISGDDREAKEPYKVQYIKSMQYISITMVV